jgi:hypothetical protein
VGNNLALSWPSTSTAVLESSVSLTSATWQTVNQTPTVANGQNTVTITPGGARNFYRLRAP